MLTTGVNKCRDLEMKNEKAACEHVECFSLWGTICFVLVGNGKLTALLVKCMMISGVLRLPFGAARECIMLESK